MTDLNSIPKKNFIAEIIENDLENKKFEGIIHTRFPPEPNGYLHIGHAKSICLNFSIADSYRGLCNLRFDDTNPINEEIEFVESIKNDVKWLGFSWNEDAKFTSDYFEQLYLWAVKLIELGKAYVDEESSEVIAKKRGTPKIPTRPSEYRNRSIKDNLIEFERMKEGIYKDGQKVLRAKIDLHSPNMHMRDPVIYRIKNSPHHRTGNQWHIYPMYDWAHGLSDSIERITHSLCTLEFEMHRPLYEWFIDELDIYKPQQIEFARLNISHTIMSKRKLKELVDAQLVEGWDDPRMPTIAGMRRRGIPAEAIRLFCDKVGIAKRENLIDYSLLEFCVREVLNKVAPRRLGVINPVLLEIRNYPEKKHELLDAINNPEDDSQGKRKIAFSKYLYICQSDFMEDAPRKFYRLSLGRKVRLKYAYIIECVDFEKDEKTGKITKIICDYIPASKSGQDTTGIKVKGTLGWVEKSTGRDIAVQLYDRLFKDAVPNTINSNLNTIVNPESWKLEEAKIEQSIEEFDVAQPFQIERLGYFVIDKKKKLNNSDKLLINRTCSLRDTWKK